MDVAQVIEARWQELQTAGWTTYKLAKEYGRLKTGSATDDRYNRYVSTVEKAISKPLSAKVETLELIKQALGIETSYSCKK